MLLIHMIPKLFFYWCEHMPLGNWLRKDTWAFAIIETVHIMALAILLGTVFVVDMRLLGLGLKRLSVTEVYNLLSPYTWTSFTIMMVTGICLFLSEAIRLSASGPFAYKMAFLILAIVVHTTIHRKVTSPGTHSAALTRLAALLSVLLWFSIALAGRAIAFL